MADFTRQSEGLLKLQFTTPMEEADINILVVNRLWEELRHQAGRLET
jgi:hypothetical protein